MTILDRVYPRLPVFLQNVACSAEGLRVRRSRYGRCFDALLAEAEQRASWSDDRLRAYRDARLSAFLRQHAASCRHYRNAWKSLGFTPESVRDLSGLSCLPVLRKTEVQDRAGDFRSPAADGAVSAHTSGTTGAGLRFAATRAALSEQWAVWWRYRRWHGIALDTWCGYFGGRSVTPPESSSPPFWRINVPGRQIMFSAYHLTPENLPFYVAELRVRRPPWLHGYPSLLAIVAAYLVDTGQDLGYQLRWITTGAENLLPHQRAVLRRAFGVEPRQHYGMAEAVANFSECEAGALHVDEDFAAVEFLPTGASSYEIVGTNFSNPATPLVRYAVGDLVSGELGACSCGRPGRVIERVDGRQEDYVVLRNGARVGRMDHIFKDMTRIREAQIVQRVPGELVYRVVRAPGFSAGDENRLLRETALRLGPHARVAIEYVDALPRTRSGKLRFVVNDAADASISGVVQRETASE